jgi:hypothetical protein
MLRKMVQALCNTAGVNLFEFVTHQSDNNFFRKHQGIYTARIEHTDNTALDKLHLNKGRDISETAALSAHPGFMHQQLACEKFFEMVRL